MDSLTKEILQQVFQAQFKKFQKKHQRGVRKLSFDKQLASDSLELYEVLKDSIKLHTDTKHNLYNRYRLSSILSMCIMTSLPIDVVDSKFPNMIQEFKLRINAVFAYAISQHIILSFFDNKVGSFVSTLVPKKTNDKEFPNAQIADQKRSREHIINTLEYFHTLNISTKTEIGNNITMISREMFNYAYCLYLLDINKEFHDVIIDDKTCISLKNKINLNNLLVYKIQY